MYLPFFFLTYFRFRESALSMVGICQRWSSKRVHVKGIKLHVSHFEVIGMCVGFSRVFVCLKVSIQMLCRYKGLKSLGGSIYNYFIYLNYVFEREKERAGEQVGEWQRKRESISSRLRVESKTPLQGWIPGPWDRDLG